MDEHASRATPRAVIEAAEDSLRDIAEGRVVDAAEVQAEARQMLAEYENALPVEGSRPISARRTRPAE